ncbi:molybdopterin molybdenumtransferase MoeA [Candidatus Poribacteria bacterium]|nr:molybdopterin molybdenumtransferase MoeA [Candidatus Poribacteria bacterium]
MVSQNYFFKVKTPREVQNILKNTAEPLESESLELSEKLLGRTLYDDLVSPVDLPGFDRAIMDGFAVQARDTFGASPSAPAYLQVAGEVKMGEKASVQVIPGQAVKVSTGSMMPEGANAVVMVEYTDYLDDKTIEVTRPAAPLDYIVGKTDDMEKGELVLEKGHTLRAQDIGALAGLGITSLSVTRKPRVTIISSGDEVVSPEKEIKYGQIRDINSYSLSSLAKQAGAVSVRMGIVPDDFNSLKERMAEGLEKSDIALVSGGSSVGTRDVTLDVIKSFEDAEILVHGISIRPGKPTIIARIGSKYLFGLPGNPVSVMITFDMFVGYLIALLSGRKETAWKLQSVKAQVNKNVASAPGREDYIGVKIIKTKDSIMAEPLLGKSALISTMVKANGLIRIPLESEGIEQGSEVDVFVF